jgi:hypothetical protein
LIQTQINQPTILSTGREILGSTDRRNMAPKRRKQDQAGGVATQERGARNASAAENQSAQEPLGAQDRERRL